MPRASLGFFAVSVLTLLIFHFLNFSRKFPAPMTGIVVVSIEIRGQVAIAASVALGVIEDRVIEVVPVVLNIDLRFSCCHFLDGDSDLDQAHPGRQI